MSQIQNIEELRNDLLKRYDTAKTDSDKKDLGTFTQAASTIIRSLRTELDYNKLKDNGKKIEFLENK